MRKGIGSDSRIGSKFLYPGCGYGGSCFPKDVKALIKTAEKHGYEMKVLNAVESVNEKQKSVLFNKLFKHYKGALQGKKIAVWGLAFKPETDDMREATSLVTIDRLLRKDAKYGCMILWQWRNAVVVWAGVWNMPQTCMILSWKWMLY